MKMLVWEQKVVKNSYKCQQVACFSKNKKSIFKTIKWEIGLIVQKTLLSSHIAIAGLEMKTKDFFVLISCEKPI